MIRAAAAARSSWSKLRHPGDAYPVCCQCASRVEAHFCASKAYFVLQAMDSPALQAHYRPHREKTVLQLLKHAEYRPVTGAPLRAWCRDQIDQAIIY